MDIPIKLLVACLACFKISMILVHEKWGDPIRDKAGVWITDEAGVALTFWGRILACFWCTSFIVAIPLAIWAFGWSTHTLIGACAIGGGTTLLYHGVGMHRLFRDQGS